MKVLVEKSLVEILTLRRKQKLLTQMQLAKKLGLSAMGLSYLEKGSRPLKLEMLELWVEELGLELEIEIKLKEKHVNE